MAHGQSLRRSNLFLILRPPKSKMTPAEFIKAKQQLETYKQDYHKAVGSLDTLLDRLKKQFDCDGLEDVDALLEGLEQRAKDLETKADKQLKEFEKRWLQALENYDRQ